MRDNSKAKITMKIHQESLEAESPAASRVEGHHRSAEVNQPGSRSSGVMAIKDGRLHEGNEAIGKLPKRWTCRYATSNHRQFQGKMNIF